MSVWRAIWSGSISFGLVNIPVKLFSGVDEQGLNFDLLHKNDLSPIRYARMCKTEEKEVAYDEIVRGYEYEKGNYVVLSDEDFDRANITVQKSIAILNFVNFTEIDPVYFDKPYYLKPDKGAEKSYFLLKSAMEETGKVGIGKYALRNREHLVVLQPYENIIIIEHLRFKESVRALEGLEISGQNVSINNDEKEMAKSLITQLAKKFNPAEYRDTYSKELKRVIDEKVSGKIPSIKGAVPEATPVPDLMKMLKKSLESQKQKTGGRNG